ncbi:ABC transporter permease [Haloarchaeobius sp. FL176]|uniref:ABC transporter permease n=1 Tax=Haloarchaeobius sp. FL176 TaxID=2967129 RepID=UPI0021483ED6|nr:ABC transporter permease [Haloarchaeobius sp. FL176]
MAASDADERARFEQVDWDAVEPSGGGVGRRSALFLASLAVVLAAFWYDFAVASPDPLFYNVGLAEGLKEPFTWDVRGIDWLFSVSLLVFVFYVLYPMYENLDRTKAYFDKLTNNRAATFALGYVTLFFFGGVFGPLLVGQPSTDIPATSRPPVSAATPLGRVDLFSVLVVGSLCALATWGLLDSLDRGRELGGFGDVARVLVRVGLGFLATFTLVGTVFNVFSLASFRTAAGIAAVVGVAWGLGWAVRSGRSFGVEQLRSTAVVLVAFGLLLVVGIELLQVVIYDLLQFDPIAGGASSTSCPAYAEAPGRGSNCYGTWDYPLGTARYGQGLIPLVFTGMRVSLQVALICSMLIVPLATLVGTVAGYVGGVVDDLLMSYTDIQQTVPAIIVYMITIHVYGRSLFVLVVVFGLFSWAGAARLVRSEVIQRREADFVTAARSAGAGHWRIMGRHILPNVSNTVLTSVTRQIPNLILAEAAIAFLALNNIMLPSWGETISSQLKFIPDGWWMSTIPVIVLSVTVLSFSVLGDALRDVLDPRSDS